MKERTVLRLTVVLFGLVLAGCTSSKYQKMQSERDRLRAAHEDARRKTDSRPIENDLTHKLLGTWQFVDIEVAAGDLSEEVAAIRYERNETTRQGLTVEFFMDQNVYRRYRGKNGDEAVTGTFKIETRSYGDMMIPYLRVFRDTGERFPEFISGASPTERETTDNISKRVVPWNWLGILFAEDTLYLTLSSVIEMTPNGWAQYRGIRCTFKRVQ